MQRRNFIESFAAVGAATGSSLFAVPSLATGTNTITETSPETAPEWIRDKKTGNFHINPGLLCPSLRLSAVSRRMRYSCQSRKKDGKTCATCW